MDIHTPFWKADGRFHMSESCAAETQNKQGPGTPPMERTTYGDVLYNSRNMPVPWCPKCAIKDNPAATGILVKGVGR